MHNPFWPFSGPEAWMAFVWFMLGASIPTLAVLLYLAVKQYRLDRDTSRILRRSAEAVAAAQRENPYAQVPYTDRDYPTQ